MVVPPNLMQSYLGVRLGIEVDGVTERHNRGKDNMGCWFLNHYYASSAIIR